MKCGDIMTADPVCCAAEDDVVSVAQLMQAEDVGSVPVIDASGGNKLIGIITDRDVTVKVVAEGRHPSNTSVGAVMSRDLVTCSPEEDLESGLQSMARHQLRRLPVVDERG